MTLSAETFSSFRRLADMTLWRQPGTVTSARSFVDDVADVLGGAQNLGKFQRTYGSRETKLLSDINTVYDQLENYAASFDTLTGGRSSGYLPELLALLVASGPGTLPAAGAAAAALCSKVADLLEVHAAEIGAQHDEHSPLGVLVGATASLMRRRADALATLDYTTSDRALPDELLALPFEEKGAAGLYLPDVAWPPPHCHAALVELDSRAGRASR